MRNGRIDRWCGMIDVIIGFIIGVLVGTIVALFIVGATRVSRENEIYMEGYLEGKKEKEN